MADPITPEVSQRICTHMNDDHPEAVLLYATAYGKVEGAIIARMTAIDPEGMDLSVATNGKDAALRIPFERRLTDSEDAHQTLIGMVRQARSQAS